MVFPDLNHITNLIMGARSVLPGNSAIHAISCNKSYIKG